MTDKRDNKPEMDATDKILEQRRKALKNILAGTGAAVTAAAMQEEWTRPVVDSIVLPAHAQTSGGVFSGTGLLTTGSIEDGEATLLAQLTDTLLPQAEAQAGGQFYVCATVVGSVVNVVISGLDSEFIPSGVKLIRRGALTLPTDGGPGPDGMITAAGGDVSPCFSGGPGGLNRPARIVSISGTEIVVQVLTRCEESEGEGQCGPGLRLTVPASNSGCLPEPSVYTGACTGPTGPTGLTGVIVLTGLTGL